MLTSRSKWRIKGIDTIVIVPINVRPQDLNRGHPLYTVVLLSF